MGKRRSRKRPATDAKPHVSSSEVKVQQWCLRDAKLESVANKDDHLVQLIENDDDIPQLWKTYAQRQKCILEPRLIQRYAWAPSLQHQSFALLSPTGTGKTLAYGLPLLLQPTKSLILVPTRELATQVQTALQNLRSSHSIIAVHGGGGAASSETQRQSLAMADIICATPGRLIDLCGLDKQSSRKGQFASKSSSLLSQVMTVVVDEADKLAHHKDLEPQVTQLLQCCHANRRVILSSATMPDNVLERWSTIWLRGRAVPVLRVGAGENVTSNHSGRIPAHIAQTLHVCAEHKKPRKLLTTLQRIHQECTGQRHSPTGIIFCATIQKLRYLQSLLQKETSYRMVVLHSQLNQDQRQAALSRLQSGQATLLIATDIAARGIHLPKIVFVINYDFPSNVEQYVHRCGRTGRTTASGHAYSFFTRNLQAMAGDLVQLLSTHNQWVDPNLAALVRNKKGPPDGADRKQAEAFEQGLPKAKKSKSSQDMPDPKSNNESDSDVDFPELFVNRIALQRSKLHLPSDSSSDDNDDGDGK